MPSVVEKSNPDLDFLKSLLPDLAKLNDYQKRQFKKRTLETLDALLCDGPYLTNKTFVPTPTPSPAYSNYSNQSNYSTHSHSTREYEGQETSVQTFIQNFSPNVSDDNYITLGAPK